MREPQTSADADAREAAAEARYEASRRDYAAVHQHFYHRSGRAYVCDCGDVIGEDETS